MPGLLVVALGFVPSTSVWVIDPVSHTQEKVDHVPYALAFAASTKEKIGRTMTEAIESVLHQPDEMQYAKTGMAFASQLVHKIKQGPFAFRMRN